MFQLLLVCHARAVVVQEVNIEADVTHRFLVSSGQPVDCRPEGAISAIGSNLHIDSDFFSALSKAKLWVSPAKWPLGGSGGSVNRKGV